MTIFWLEPKRTYMPGADLAWPESAPVLRTSENSASKHELKKKISVNPQSYSVLKTPPPQKKKILPSGCGCLVCWDLHTLGHQDNIT